MKFYKKSELNLNNIYDSIETLPIWNWNKINSTSNLDFLLISKFRKKSLLHKIWDFIWFNTQNIYIKDLESIWLKIQNEYIERYDVSEQYKKLIEIKSNIALHKIDFYLYNKKVARTYWQIEELRLKDAISDEEISFEKSFILVQKYAGFQINQKILTTQEYFDWIKTINNG